MFHAALNTCSISDGARHTTAVGGLVYKLIISTKGECQLSKAID